MPIVTARCVVLRTYPFSDTSKILRLMTLEHGPRSAIAKGARRPKSRFGGLIEPFAEGHATLYLRENRDLHTLSDFDLVRERQALGRDLGRFAAASALCELVMRLAPEHRDEGLFRILTGGLDALLEVPPSRVDGTALRALWRIVARLGFAPDLKRCLSCGRSIEDEDARFDLSAGGLRCHGCGDGGARLSAGEVGVLRALAGRGDFPGSPHPRQIRLLGDFVRHHMAEGLTLRSLEFLEER